MDVNLWAALIGIMAGVTGYWFTTFSVQPILRFRDLKNKTLMEFIYYAQVVNADRLNEEMKNLYRERCLANRKTSALLSAAVLDLPWWYLFYLKRGKLDPGEAAKHLIGYSNTTDYGEADKKEWAIRQKLGLPQKS